MPRAYIRRGLLMVGSAGRLGPGHVAPEAASTVEAFRECGWDVVVVGGAPDLPNGLDAIWMPSVEERDSGAWLLTNDVTDDRWARPLGLRTALVGSQIEHSGPARCDVAFRDLRTATFEILATDVPVASGARAGR